MRTLLAFGALAAVTTFIFVAATPATGAQLSQQQAVDTLPEKVIGFSLGPFAQQQRTAGVENRRIKSTGANTVSLSVWWEFDERTSTARPGEMTNPDREVRLAIQSVRANGMSAAILPLLMCTSCETNWRGSIEPSNKTAFYESYRGMIERYAKIAQEEGVSLLFVGSEMSSTQGDTAEWREIAATARSVYSGAIAYDVNWDAVDGVKFWDAVDIPSISAYFPLSDKRSPNLDTLKRAWHKSEVEHWMGRNSVAEVQKLASRTGKRVLFGEAGYRSIDWGTKLPFDYAHDEGDPNPALQADAYQALIETFDDKPYWRGVLWWEWDLNTSNPERETGFTPRGKAAEDVVRAWYAEGIRPSPDSPRLADRSSQSGGGSNGRTTSGQSTSGRNPPTSPGSRADGAQPTVDAPADTAGVAGAAGADIWANGDLAAPARQGDTPSSLPARTVAAVVAGGLLVVVVVGATSRRGA